MAPRNFSLRRLLWFVACGDFIVVTAITGISRLSIFALSLAMAWGLAEIALRRTPLVGGSRLLRMALLTAAFAGPCLAVSYFEAVNATRHSGGTAGHAIWTLRTLVTSEEKFKAADRAGRYAGLAGLNMATPPYIDSVLSSGRASGYSFVVSTDGGKNFTVTAAPLHPYKGPRSWLLRDLNRPATEGRLYLFTDSSGVIRFRWDGPATSAGAPIE